MPAALRPTSVQTKRIFAIGAWALFLVLAARAQRIPADEIRISTQPYRLPAPPALRVQTNLVMVPVVVRDTAGKIVAGLKQEDFQVFDNGKPQTIISFSAETPARLSAPAQPAPAAPANAAPASVPAFPPAATPRRYVALFFDDLNLPVGDLAPVRKAAQEFVRHDLEAGDRVAIFTSSTIVTLGFTDDLRKVVDTLALLKPRVRRPSVGVSCPRMSAYQAYQIVNFNDQASMELGIEQGIAEQCFSRDSNMVASLPGIVKNQAFQMISLVDQYSRDTLIVLKDVLQYVGKLSGRRMVVLASSGFLTMSTPLRRSQDSLVEIALRTGVVIHSLDAKGLAADAVGSDVGNGPPSLLMLRPDLQQFADSLAREQHAQMSEAMSFLAGGTGGRFFHGNNDFGRGFRELTATPEVLYMLGYAPDNLKPDSTYHALKVTLTGAREYKLDARRGYFAPDKLRLPPVVPPDKFDLAVQGSDALAEFVVGATTRPEKSAGQSALRVQVRLTTRDLPFLRREDRSVENVRFVLALFDAQGKFHSGVEGEWVLNLKDETLARLAEHGLEQAVSLRAPPGAYKLRLVVQERMHGRLAAQTYPVAVM
jgi:VWFA-related protein